MLLETSCPTELKRTPLHNSKGTPSYLSQLERNTKSSTTTQLKSFAITRKEPPATKLGTTPLTKTGENFPAKTREEPSGTLCLEKSPCATNSDEDSEVTQEKPVTTRMEQPHVKQLGAPKQQVVPTSTPQRTPR